MRLAAFYAAACFAALAGLSAVQLGWQPEFVAVWDSRSRLYLNGLFAIPAFLFALALSDAVPTSRLPERLRSFPGALLFLGPVFLMVGIVELSPLSDSAEIRHELTRSTAYGLATGLLVGLIYAIWPPKKDGDAPKEGLRHGLVIGMAVAAMVVLLLLLMQTRPRDDGKFEESVRFGTSEAQLVVGTYSAVLGGGRYGTLRIRQGEAQNLLIMEGAEWQTLVEVWRKAQAAQSTSWRVVGEAHDTAPSEHAKISLAAGRGVRFTIQSRNSPTVSYQLAPSDMAAFDAAMTSIEPSLNN